MSVIHTPAGGQRYRLNEPAVVADILDGDAVVMHLERGNYFGLDNIGAEIWTLILGGYTLGEITDAVVERYDLDQQRVISDMRHLVTQMVDEDLIVAAPDAAAPDRLPTAEQFHATAYSTPALRIYRDMKDLLALDPPLPDFSAKVPH